MPPALPGASYVTILPVNFVLSGDLSSFDVQAFRTNLLNLVFPDATDVILNVTAGSVYVAAQLIMPSIA